MWFRSPPPLFLSPPGLPRPHGCPHYRRPSHWLDPPLSPPTPAARKRAVLIPDAISAVGLTCLWPSAAVVLHLVRRFCWPLRPLPAHRCTAAAVSSRRPGCSGGGWVFVPYPPPLFFLPRSALSRCGSSGGFVPPGLVGHFGVFGALRQLDSPAHSVVPPPQGFSATQEASRPPPPCSSLQGTRGLLWRPCGPHCLPALPRLRFLHFPAGLRYFILVPASPHSSCAPPSSSVAAEGDFPVSPPPARASTCIPPAPLSCMPNVDAVSVSPLPSLPPHGHPVLLRLCLRQILCVCTAPPLTRFVAPPKDVPLAAMPPVSVAAHL